MRTVVDGFVEVPRGYLYYRQHGHGPDVVLLNAGLADVRMWDTTVAWLAGIARVTTWDYRDTGLSSWSSGPYSEIDDLEAVLDAAGVSRATLVGVSDGGRQALAFAHRHPDRVAKVCAVASSFGEFPDPSAQETAARRRMREVFAEVEEHVRSRDILAASVVDVDAWSPAANPDDRRRLIGWHVANARILTMEQYHGVELDPPVKTRFAEIGTPVAVFAGGRDFEGTQLWARRIADQAPTASLFTAPDADHYPMFSDPGQFERFLREAVANPG
ncbi:alpha/beta fold hydrolase [Winogradskya humida]|uniref:alpha/beta fold hydrolase n=1 Tax=Winogradskya humida TaxID=113566 RepID=UPI0019441C5D|nr:alpha/beta hydrolase [Actinoplanes humidus]